MLGLVTQAAFDAEKARADAAEKEAANTHRAFLSVEADLLDARAEAKKQTDLRASDASIAKDILDGERKKTVAANRLIETLNAEIAREVQHNAEAMETQNAFHAGEMSTLEKRLAALQEALRASQVAHAAEAARHVAKRAEAHGEALAHAETTRLLGALREELAVQRKRAETAEASAAAAHAHADATVAAFRGPKPGAPAPETPVTS